MSDNDYKEKLRKGDATIVSAAAAQELAEQCDQCGVHVPNGEGRYRICEDRICEDCDIFNTTSDADHDPDYDY